MATRVVYVYPGDLIDIRIIDDQELPRNSTEWKYQVRPASILLQYKGYKCIGYADAAMRFENKFIDSGIAQRDAAIAAAAPQEK